MNLLNNAYDATKSLSERWVRIGVLDAGSHVEIRFSNSGPEIPIDIREKLFQPFFTTKEIGKGTGIGLSISKGIIENHKGSISLEQSPSLPTCFIVRLPKMQLETQA